jgi:hypothetical protein
MPKNSIASMAKNPFKSVKEEKHFEDLTDENIDKVFRETEGNSARNEKSLIYIDDMTASLKASYSIQETLKKIVFNRRHNKTNLIITAQSYINIPKDLRKTITNLILFRPSKTEFEDVFRELFESSKEHTQKIMKLAFLKPHSFLFLNVPTQRMFINWDEIIINEEGESDDDVEKKVD